MNWEDQQREAARQQAWRDEQRRQQEQRERDQRDAADRRERERREADEAQRRRDLENQRFREQQEDLRRAREGQSVSSLQGDQIYRDTKRTEEDRKDAQDGTHREQRTGYIDTAAAFGSEAGPGIVVSGTRAHSGYRFPWGPLVGVVILGSLFTGIIANSFETTVRHFLIGLAGIVLLALIVRTKPGRYLEPDSKVY